MKTRLVSMTVIIGTAALWACAGLAAEPFDYFQNSWSVVGLKDYKDATRVNPENELLLADGRKLRFSFGRNLTPLSRVQTKTLLQGWLPIVLFTAWDEGVRYDFTIWATPLPTVEDWRAAFDWPTEGENFLNWIKVGITNTRAEPADVKVRCDVIGSSRMVAEPFARTLDAGAGTEYVVRVLFAPMDDETVIAQEDPGVWLDRTVAYWSGLLAKAARIETPCEKTNEALRAAHVCQLIASDHGELHGGEGFYDRFYIRDGGYQIMQLEEAGLWNAVENTLKSYLAAQCPDGRFETQKGQLDANGQAVWVLWQYYKITGDKDWLAKVWPQMRRSVDWIMKARRQAPAHSPFAGLLPAAVADGEFLWDGQHHIVGYDFWNLRAMLCAADAAAILGKQAEADALSDEIRDYLSAIDAACRRTGLGYFPPSWEGAGTHWGNTETLWPTELFDPEDLRVVGTLDHARTRHGGGFVEGTIRWLGKIGKDDAIHPYMSAYTTMATLVRGDSDQVVEDFYWYLLHSSATHAFPEGVFYERRFAWNDTIPHCTGAANYALLLRHMLVHERGDALHLLPAVPDWWLSAGKEICVERAPTHFGRLSLKVVGLEDGVKVDFVAPVDRPPTRVFLHLPRSRPLVGSRAGITVVTRPDQKDGWDFPTVVALYERQAPMAISPSGSSESRPR